MLYRVYRLCLLQDCAAIQSYNAFVTFGCCTRAAVCLITPGNVYSCWPTFGKCGVESEVNEKCQVAIFGVRVSLQTSNV